jgi:hypothetical protein
MWAFCNHDDYARMTVAVQYGADLAQTFTELPVAESLLREKQLHSRFDLQSLDGSSETVVPPTVAQMCFCF